MNQTVQTKYHRFTVITNSLIRIEENTSGDFEDRPTTAVLNRNFGTPNAKILENHNRHQIEIITDTVHLYYDGGKFAPQTLYADIKIPQSLHTSRWYFGSENAEGTHNLKGTARTLDRSNGPIPLKNGIMSRDGYSYLDDSDSFLYIKENNSFSIRPNTEIIDGYLFTYGHAYQKELTDFYHLTGFTPLIPRFALGNWWSRYHAYSEAEYIDLMKKFKTERIPINVSVIDTDWHRENIPAKYGSSWTGFSWNRKLFPSPSKFLEWLHKEGKHVSLNIHPADGIRAFEDQYPAVAKDMHLDTKVEEPAAFNLQNSAFRNAYFKDVLHPLEKEGVDFWWIDWQQGSARSSRELDPLWLLNYYQYQDIKKEKPNNALILSRYAGIGSHRYPIGFSGDTVISWKTLDFQPYFTSTADNVGYSWWSHDIGGHMMGSFDGELSTRWLQFGVFSPINRLHSSNNLFSGKEPWKFRTDYELAQKRFLRLRTELVPYLDTANEATHSQGIPLVRPLYYLYPEDDRAYQMKNEYFFGSEMLVSPITTPHDKASQLGKSTTWLPKGEWIDYFNHLSYKGNTVLQTYRSVDQMPVFVKKGSLIITNPNYMESIESLPKELRVEIFPGHDCVYELVEHQQGKIAKTRFIWDQQRKKLTWTVSGDVSIIPKNRHIEKILIKPADPKEEMRKRLQSASIAYDLKQKLYLAFTKDDYRYSNFINLLNQLSDDNIRNMCAELAYIRGQNE